MMEAELRLRHACATRIEEMSDVGTGIQVIRGIRVIGEFGRLIFREIVYLRSPGALRSTRLLKFDYRRDREKTRHVLYARFLTHGSKLPRILNHLYG